MNDKIDEFSLERESDDDMIDSQPISIISLESQTQETSKKDSAIKTSPIA